MRLNSCEELDSFQSVIHDALNSCIPMRTVKQHPNANQETSASLVE